MMKTGSGTSRKRLTQANAVLASRGPCATLSGTARHVPFDVARIQVPKSEELTELFNFRRTDAAFSPALRGIAALNSPLLSGNLLLALEGRDRSLNRQRRGTDRSF